MEIPQVGKRGENKNCENVSKVALQLIVIQIFGKLLSQRMCKHTTAIGTVRHFFCPLACGLDSDRV
jgi:hypothetical protein